MVQVELRSRLGVHLAMRPDHAPARLRDGALSRPTAEDFGSLRETYAEYLARLAALTSRFVVQDEHTLDRAA